MTAAPSLQRRWTVRQAHMGDAAVILALWLEEWGMDGRFASQFSNRKEFADLMKPVLEHIIRRETTHALVAVDSECDDSVWGLAVFHANDGVYTAFVKRAFRRAGWGEEILSDLLGDRLDRKQYFAQDLAGLRRAHVEPSVPWVWFPWLGLGEE